MGSLLAEPTVIHAPSLVPWSWRHYFITKRYICTKLQSV